MTESEVPLSTSSVILSTSTNSLANTDLHSIHIPNDTLSTEYPDTVVSVSGELRGVYGDAEIMYISLEVQGAGHVQVVVGRGANQTVKVKGSRDVYRIIYKF